MRGRLGIYSDDVLRLHETPAGVRISTDQAFLLFAAEVGRHFDEALMFGRGVHVAAPADTVLPPGRRRRGAALLRAAREPARGGPRRAGDDRGPLARPRARRPCLGARPEPVRDRDDRARAGAPAARRAGRAPGHARVLREPPAARAPACAARATPGDGSPVPAARPPVPDDPRLEGRMRRPPRLLAAGSTRRGRMQPRGSLARGRSDETSAISMRREAPSRRLRLRPLWPSWGQPDRMTRSCSDRQSRAALSVHRPGSAAHAASSSATVIGSSHQHSGRGLSHGLTAAASLVTHLAREADDGRRSLMGGRELRSSSSDLANVEVHRSNHGSEPRRRLLMAPSPRAARRVCLQLTVRLTVQFERNSGQPRPSDLALGSQI
jgi:hypothetical protein